MTNIWKNLQIEPDLVEFITLTPQDVNVMTRQALRYSDPSAKLSDLLNLRGRIKRDLAEARKKERMAIDRDFIADSVRWPSFRLRLKTQPWISPDGSRRRYGAVDLNEIEGGLFLVHVDGGATEEFRSIEAMVEVWSVD